MKYLKEIMICSRFDFMYILRYNFLICGLLFKKNKRIILDMKNINKGKK